VAITRDEEIKQLEAQADTLQRRLWMLEQQQRPFIHQLLNALPVSNSPLLIIFTMRADFLHRAAEHPELAKAIGEHDLIVSPMTADELRRAIERPAEAAGAGFEHGLVDELIKQTVDRPGALPLLEYALLELWKTKRADGLLTWAALLRTPYLPLKRRARPAARQIRPPRTSDSPPNKRMTHDPPPNSKPILLNHKPVQPNHSSISRMATLSEHYCWPAQRCSPTRKTMSRWFFGRCTGLLKILYRDSASAATA